MRSATISPRRRLVGSFPHDHGGNGRDHDPHVKPRALRFYEQTVERDAGPVADIAAAADLPEAGDSRLHGAVVTKPAAIARDLRFHDRTRADNAHLAAQHVEQLRKLIEARASQERAQRRDPRIDPELVIARPFRARRRAAREQRREPRFRANRHRAELQAVRSEEHTSELQSLAYLVCRLLLEKKKTNN